MQTQIAPTGGCPGKLYAGRTAALCLRCAREPIGGPQIAPAWFRIAGEPDCPNFVAHGVHVQAIPAEGRPPSSGGQAPTTRGASHAPLQPGVSQARCVRSLGDDT